MKGNWLRPPQSRFWLVCYQILIRNKRKLASAGSEQILVDLLLNSIGNERKLASAGSEQILVDLQSYSNKKCKAIGRLAQSRFWLICY